ncbi:MAG: xanthine dehydrogenase molybdopterin binding subunit [Bacteroidota bacterium]
MRAPDGRALPLPHESAELHVTGEACFVDDLPLPGTALIGHVVTSPHAHAALESFDLSEARSIPGVHAVLSARDIPGRNQIGHVVEDDPCLAEHETVCVGQAVFLIAAETEEVCRRAAAAVSSAYRPLEAVLTLDEAMARGTLLGRERTMHRGDVRTALAASPHVHSGELRTGAQEHWYLETQACVCVPHEGGEMAVFSSTQNPSETQSTVAGVLGIPRNRVIVEVRRMGGAFGGKETQANHVACWTALLAASTRRPVKIRLSRDADMIMTGKRHGFLIRYTAGFDDNGRILGAEFELNSDAGSATDLSHAIMERAMLHIDGAYYLPALSLTARVWRTNLPSNTAMRGFGGPQAMAAVETILDRIARFLGHDAAAVRRLNFYGDPPRDVTHYGQTVTGNRLPALYDGLVASAEYARRRKEADAFNAGGEFLKRGLALTPVKFGISFTTTFLNQAGALVHVYSDGTILVHHGGTEMGQGLHTKIRQVAAAEFGVDTGRVRVSPTNTAAVPNTSPTAASSGTDLNGAAVRNAIRTIKERIARSLAAEWSARSPSSPTVPAEVVFEGAFVADRSHPDRRIAFGEAAALMHHRQVSLSAAGFYRTPDIGWDKAAGVGRPFAYFAFGMAVSEVLLDTLTGRVKLLRTDILHDVGQSLHPGIDRGQIEGGFLQGLGWVTTEEILRDDRGNLLTHSPDTYKIPATGDVPGDFRVEMLAGAPNPGVVGQSKAVGEPPFMLALSVWMAVKDALSAVGNHRFEPDFCLPATTEMILLSAEKLRAQAGEQRPR